LVISLPHQALLFMKKLLVTGVLAAGLTALGQSRFTPQPFVIPQKPATTNKVDFARELEAVTARLKQQFDSGKTSETEMLRTLGDVNDLIAKYALNGNRKQVARLYLLDAHIYADGMTNKTKARAIWNQVVRDYPGTAAAQGASLSLAKLNAEIAAEPDPQVPEGLKLGQKFPGFSETDFGGKPLSLSAYRGKVTMIDFWATWCGPCRDEMPNVIATYRKYHAQGFEIIGVSLDENRTALANYVSAQGLVWSQYFDGQGWGNKLAKKCGVESIPMDYLLDRHGVIIGKGLRGENLRMVVAGAVKD
jgi:thiol-disulfide isomerase/thioredoxin